MLSYGAVATNLASAFRLIQKLLSLGFHISVCFCSILRFRTET